MSGIENPKLENEKESSNNLHQQKDLNQKVQEQPTEQPDTVPSEKNINEQKTKTIEKNQKQSIESDKNLALDLNSFQNPNQDQNGKKQTENKKFQNEDEKSLTITSQIKIENLLDSKRYARQLENDARMLTNRINLLRMEHIKSEKKIMQNKKKAKEFARNRQNSEMKIQEKLKFQEMKNIAVNENKNYINRLRDEKKIGKGELLEKIQNQRKRAASQIRERTQNSEKIIQT